jgi:hypothetical protein
MYLRRKWRKFLTPMWREGSFNMRWIIFLLWGSLGLRRLPSSGHQIITLDPAPLPPFVWKDFLQTG